MNRKPTTLAGKLATACMLLAFMLASAPGSLSATGLQDVGNPSSASDPERIIHTANARPGIYYLDYGGSAYRFDPAVYPVDGGIRFFGWSELNTASGAYNWPRFDDWLAERKALGLGTGIMITTYDGSGSGDIRSTPNFVIKTPDAVLPATAKECTNAACTTFGPEYPHYVNYWKAARYNAGFDYSPHDYVWNLTGNTAVIPNPPADPDSIASGYAAQLGGADSATDTLWHNDERIPAMPAGISPTQTVYVTARVHIATTDPNPNDHLYVEIWDTSNNKLGGTQLDINNLSHANNTWKSYTFDVSSFATERSVRVAFRSVTDAANPTTFYVDAVTLNVRHLIPKYWGAAYSNAYKTFINALGARYKTNTDLQFVAMGTGVYGENQPTQSDNYPDSHFDHVVSNAGLTQQGWIDYVNFVTDSYAAAFNLVPGQGPNRHLLLQYSPVYKSVDEREKTTDYAASRAVGLSANFLAPDWTQAYRSDGDGQYDPIRKYYNQVPIAFESYPSDLCSPVLAYWALIGGVEKHADYIRADISLIRNWSDGSLTENAPFYDWAGQYLGKTVQNAPQVWTVMREHRNPTRLNCRPGGLYYATGGGMWPQLGNFNYWLYQVDGIPGGRTVPETNDKGADSRYARNPSNSSAYWPLSGLGACPTNISYRTDLYGVDYPCYSEPYNPDLPPLLTSAHLADYTKWYEPRNFLTSGKEAYIVRRTDQNSDPAKDNPFMFFMIDDGYMDPVLNQVYKATIRVKYFDIGADKWSLKYHSQGATSEKTAGVITKTDTKLRKEAVFTITDGKFANGLTGGADFYLDSRDPTTNTNDGNEWVHMVEVEKLDAQNPPTPTPTVTPTATQTPTPTVTPTATPSTGIVEGKAFHDINSNGSMDAGEPGLAGAVLALKQSGAEVYTATSDASGLFRFPTVAPGQYQLIEKSPPPGYLHNTSFGPIFFVNANQTLSGDFFNVGHQPAPTPTATSTATPTATSTATPTATPTATSTATPTATFTPTPEKRKVYLPIVLVSPF